MRKVARMVGDKGFPNVREIAASVGSAICQDAVGVRQKRVGDQRTQQGTKAHKEMKSLQKRNEKPALLLPASWQPAPPMTPVCPDEMNETSKGTSTWGRTLDGSFERTNGIFPFLPCQIIAT